MKRILYLSLFVTVALAFFNCADLPEAVEGQSKEDAVESDQVKVISRTDHASRLKGNQRSPAGWLFR